MWADKRQSNKLQNPTTWDTTTWFCGVVQMLPTENKLLLHCPQGHNLHATYYRKIICFSTSGRWKADLKDPILKDIKSLERNCDRKFDMMVRSEDNNIKCFWLENVEINLLQPLGRILQCFGYLQLCNKRASTQLHGIIVYILLLSLTVLGADWVRLSLVSWSCSQTSWGWSHLEASSSTCV